MNLLGSGRLRAAGLLALALVAASGCDDAGTRPPAATGKPAKSGEKSYEPPDERFVFFANGRTDVLPDGFFAIGYVAALLDADAALHILVVGHADQRGKSDFNRDLSFRRARVVRKVLVDHGVKENRIQVAAPHEGSETSPMADLSRRADMYVFDPQKDDASKRLGYAVEVKDE
jgi:hypothetical protein